MDDGMCGGFFEVNFKPEHRQSFLNASIFAAQSVVSEDAEVFQFHFMADTTNPNRFYFYEVFRNETAVQAHRDSETSTNWSPDETVWGITGSIGTALVEAQARGCRPKLLIGIS